MATHIDGLPDFSVPSLLRWRRDKAALMGASATITVTVDVDVSASDGAKHAIRTTFDLTIDEVLDVLARRGPAELPRPERAG